MLRDLRAVELCRGMAGQVTGLLLAEFGADVLKIEPSGGDPTRGTAGFANWNRGKRSLECDIHDPDGRATLDRHLAGADILVHDLSPARAAALGLDDARLAAAFPRLVVCGITGSPRRHPDVERSDDELLVAARLGVLYENDGHRPGPIVWRYRMGSWSAANLAFAAITARLLMRLQSGTGGGAHTSLYQGFLAKLPLVWGRNGAGPMPNPAPRPSDRPTATSMQLFECAGGKWLQIMDPAQQLDYSSLPTMWEVLAEGVDVDTPEGLAEAFRRRPVERWEADLRAADVAVEPAQPMGEMLTHPDVVANGYVVDVDDPDLGRTRQPNLPIHTDAPLVQGRPAPRLGEGGDKGWAAPPVPAVASAPPPAHPLADVRVLDLGMFLAGPMGPSMMGDMGADVIKLEPLTGDRIRFMHRYYQAAARSKRSIALDLGNPAARPILERLVGWADVVHHNMRPRAAAKLGITKSDFQAIKPDVVFSYVSAYGQRGTRGDWKGYDSIFNAIAGWEFENAGEGNRPVFNRPGTMDVASAQTCLVGIMASLYAQRATGATWSTEASLLGAATFSQGERLLLADGALTPVCRLDAAQTGFSPWHRIYRAGGGWIAVAAHDEAARSAMRDVLGADETGFEAAFAGRAADEVFAALDMAGVPSDRVVYEDALNRFLDDPVSEALGLVSRLEQPLYGLIEQPGAFWDFGDVPLAIERACPTIGQHSDEIMRDLGFSAAEIAAFRERRVIC